MSPAPTQLLAYYRATKRSCWAPGHLLPCTTRSASRADFALLDIMSAAAAVRFGRGAASVEYRASASDGGGAPGLSRRQDCLKALTDEFFEWDGSSSDPRMSIRPRPDLAPSGVLRVVV